MMMLSWDERGTLVPFSSTDELDQLLDRVVSEANNSGLPTVATLLDADDPEGPALSIGCGDSASVAVWRTPQEPAALLSCAERAGSEGGRAKQGKRSQNSKSSKQAAQGKREDRVAAGNGEPVEFFFCGEPVKYPASAVISPELARTLARSFFVNGARPDEVGWQRLTD